MYYIDQFHTQFNLVQMMDLWNVNYVTVTVIPAHTYLL